MIRRKSFVLVELLVAIAIFAVTITLVYTTLYTGLKAYHRTQTQLYLSRDIDAIIDGLAVELRNSLKPYEVMFEEGKEEIFGREQSLSFFTIHNAYTEEGMKKLLARVSYYLRDGTLYKKRQLDKNALAEENNIKEEELLTNIESFELNYLTATAGVDGLVFSWPSVWGCAREMPHGVRIKLVWRNPETEMSVEVTRYIVIVQGVLNCMEIEL